jgi:deoxyxylulose-5-phosphate synthase
MEAEIIAIIISCTLSGLMLLWKLIRRLRKSKCYIENDNGDKITLDFGSVEKELNEELTQEQIKKIKEILEKNITKSESKNQNIIL